MMNRLSLVIGLLLLPVTLWAQPAAGAFTTLRTTSANPDGLCVGCPVGSQAPAANSGLKAVTMTIPTSAPSVTTDKLYNFSTVLRFSGLDLMTGVVGANTVNTLPIFTANNQLGNSIFSQAAGAGTVTGSLVTTTTLASGTTLTAGSTLTSTTSTTVGTTLTVNGAGPHIVNNSNTSGTRFQIRNQNTGTGAFSSLDMGNSASAVRAFLNILSTGYTPTGPYLADGFVLEADGAGGVSLVAGHATTGLIRGYTGGTTQRFAYDNSGNYSLGATTANLTDAVATPTIASGFGTSPSIAGKDYAFTVTIGTGSPTSGTVTFNATYGNVPVCTAGIGIGTQQAIGANSTTTGVALNFPALTSGWTVMVLCRGY